jgi:hypothetical protein
MLPPTVSSAVDDLMKADLQYWRDYWFQWLLWSARAVVCGVFLEGPDLWYELSCLVHRKFGQWTSKEKHQAPDWVTVAALLGWILVVAGVAGEVVTESFISQADGNLQTFNDVLLTEARKEAGAAKASAESAAAASSKARQQASEVAIQADNLTTRMGVVSRQLDNVEQELLLQGPRSRLLLNGKRTFIKALKPFAGQRVTVVICGNQETERWTLEQALINDLREAGWNLVGYMPWAACGTMRNGTEVYFSSTVPAVNGSVAEMKDWLHPDFTCRPAPDLSGIEGAAHALCSELNKLKIRTFLWEERPVLGGALIARKFLGFDSLGSPGEMAVTDPTTIFILVGYK